MNTNSQRTLDTAREQGGAATVIASYLFTNYSEYTIAGRHANYSVFYDGVKGYTCTCPAGERGVPCWHWAAAEIYRTILPVEPDRQPVLTPIASKPIVRCFCGSALNDRGTCLDDMLFGRHRHRAMAAEQHVVRPLGALPTRLAPRPGTPGPLR
jgi:hypothetical protein